MKIIAVGDPHFQTDNIPEVNLFIEKMIDLVKTEKPDFITILGDVLHTHEKLHTIPLNKAYEFVFKMREFAKTFVLVGNHDLVNNQQFLTPNHWMNGMKEWDNVVVVDKIEKYKIQDYQFLFCPYVPPGKFQQALDTEPEWKNSNCIFAHQEFFGCKMGAIQSVDGDRWPIDYPPIVSGHIHSKQTPQENIYYCGASMQHAFGESEINIIPILNWNDPKEKYDLTEIDLGLPRKKILYTDIENIDECKIDISQDKVKLSVSGNYEEFKVFKKTKKYKDLVKKGAKVVFKPKKNIVQKEENEIVKLVENAENQNFTDILLTLINKEKNPLLLQAYELVFNNKIIDEEEILYV